MNNDEFENQYAWWNWGREATRKLISHEVQKILLTLNYMRPLSPESDGAKNMCKEVLKFIEDCI